MASSARSDPPTGARGGVTIGIVASLLPLATVCLALRFYARRYISHSTGIDDWVTLVALVSKACAGPSPAGAPD